MENGLTEEQKAKRIELLCAQTDPKSSSNTMDTLDMNSSIQRKQDTGWDQIAKDSTASMWKMATDLKV